MKKISMLLLFSVLLMPCIAQQMGNAGSVYGDYAAFGGKNVVKFNITGALTRNFGFYGERILGKRVSAVLGVNFMPKGGIPYASSFTDDESVRTLQLGTFSVTPEIRFYLGPGYGRGFYVAPYYRFERYTADNFRFTYDDENDNEQTFDLKGSVSTNSLGAVIGCQWFVGRKKNVVLDWSIIGAHYGASSGNFDGTTTDVMTQQEQANLKQEIEDVLTDIPMIDSEVTVNASSVNANIDGPWAFFRMAFSVGYRF